MTNPDQFDRFPGVADTEAAYLKFAAIEHKNTVLAKFCNNRGCWQLRHTDQMWLDEYKYCEAHITEEERNRVAALVEHRDIYWESSHEFSP